MSDGRQHFPYVCLTVTFNKTMYLEDYIATKLVNTQNSTSKNLINVMKCSISQLQNV